MADKSQQTEKPTQRKLEKARKEGQFPVSKEFVHGANFLVFVALAGTKSAAEPLQLAGLHPQVQSQVPPQSAPLSPQTSQASKPISLTIPRLEHAPSLDDFLSMQPAGETASQMVRVTGFVQRNPHDGEAVTEPTEAYLGYDEKNLYAVFICFDDPQQVRARMSVREDVYDDDQVEVILDTFHDRRRAYAFQTTPLGVQWDAIWTEASRDEQTQGHFDTSFDTVWDSRGKITPRGFVVYSIMTPEQIPTLVRGLVGRQPILDMHTHLYPPTFGTPVANASGNTDPAGLMLWGVDELVTYHYLIAEIFRVLPAGKFPYDQFWKMTREQQADLGGAARALRADRARSRPSDRGGLGALREHLQGRLRDGLDAGRGDDGAHRTAAGDQILCGWTEAIGR